MMMVGRMEAKQVPALFLLPVFFVLFSISERFPFSRDFCKIWRVIFCRSFSLTFLVCPSEKSQSCTWLTQSKKRKEACERFPACCGRARRPWQRIRHPQLPLVLSRTAVWSAANHPWTRSCEAAGSRSGHKVSVISFECVSMQETLHDKPHTQ